MDVPAGQADVAGAGLLKEKPVGGGVILKLAFDISKKIFPTASTFILAVEVIVPGITTSSVPSLGVLANSIEKLLPPSVDIRILTLAQLTGGAVVLFTNHVTV